MYIWLEFFQEQAKGDEREKNKEKRKETVRVLSFKILGKGGRNPYSCN